MAIAASLTRCKVRRGRHWSHILLCSCGALKWQRVDHNSDTAFCRAGSPRPFRNSCKTDPFSRAASVPSITLQWVPTPARLCDVTTTRSETAKQRKPHRPEGHGDGNFLVLLLRNACFRPSRYRPAHSCRPSKRGTAHRMRMLAFARHSTSPRRTNSRKYHQHASWHFPTTPV